MKNIANALIAGICCLQLTACGAADPGNERSEATEEPVVALERDLGGAAGVMDLFETHSAEDIRLTLQAYGMAWSTQTWAIDACPQYFPASDRSTWHSLNGEHFYIDASGRPLRAYSYLPPIASEARSTTCQGNVGQWGDAENPSNDYDGGHLIGSQLGGWGKRANLVPQDANFNRGNWVVLENKMADCAGLPNGRVRYYISVSYSNSTKLVPSTFGMQITNQSTGSSVSLSFSNTDSGGSNDNGHNLTASNEDRFANGRPGDGFSGSQGAGGLSAG
jgi:hypothetical protein